MTPALGGRRLRPALIIALATIVALAPMAADADAAKRKRKAATVKVMTRNVYLGADLTPALAASDLCGAIDGAGAIVNEIDRTDFPARSVALAQEILAKKPHLVGLQEVALWRQQEDADYTVSPATEVRYDFLQLLMDQLGGKYKVLHVQEEFDEELPADVDGSDATEDAGPFAFLGCGIDIDGRLTMRDVILLRKGTNVRAGSPQGAHYDTIAEFTVGGSVTVPVERGWQSVEAKVNLGRKYKPNKFRFINTHLEAFDDGEQIREKQAKELIAKGGPARTSKKVVLLGDFNSGNGPGDKVFGKDQLAYKALTGFGFQNFGIRQTCCYPSALNDPGYVFDHTVDHVMAKPSAKLLGQAVTGNDPAQMVESSMLEMLWPSDHGGAFAKIKLRK